MKRSCVLARNKMAESENDFVIIDKLANSESFEIWKFQIKIVFKAHAQWEIVSGEIKIEDLTKEDEKASWKRKDARAQKTIITRKKNF